MPKKTIFITGVAGFIGSNLADYYLKKEYNIIGMDNLLTGDINNIAKLLKQKKFTFHQNDITKHIDIAEPIDYILHFASPASPVDYVKIPIQTLKVGALGTLNCLGLAKKKKARILVASTSEVYGDPLVNPQPETYWGNVNPVGVRSVYDEAKRYLEAITMAYHHYHRVDTRIVRIFNTYGPRMRLNDGRALPTFIRQAMLNEPLTVFGKGTQTRSFCYISDLVEGIHRLLLLDNYHHPVNLGNPEETTILAFAKEILTYFNQKTDNIIFKSLPENDPQQRKPDITLAKQLLDWSPIVSRETGIRKVMDYHAELPKEYFLKNHRFE